MTLSKQYILYGAVSVLLFGGLLLSLAIPSFGAGGGDNSNNILIIALAAFIFIYLVVRKEDDSPAAVSFSLPLIVFSALFVLSMFATIFVSIDKHAALLGGLEWTMAVVLFYASALWAQKDAAIARGITMCIVFGAALYAIIGFFTFTNDLGYLHLTSLLPEHNPFGGFLFIPLLLSLSFIYTSIDARMRALFIGTSIVIGAALILTFSRGSWLSLIIALVIAAIVFRKSIPRPLPSRVLLRFAVVAIGIVVVSGGLYLLAKEMGRLETTAVTAYIGEVVPTDSTIDRLYYFKDSFAIIAAHPLGIGMGNYPIVAQENRTTVLHFSFDPHSIYLRMIAEIGIIGGALFIIFLLYFFLGSVRNIVRSRGATAPSPLVYALCIGVGAVLIHAAIDFDFNYPLIIFTFFISAGLLYGSAYVPMPSREIPPKYSAWFTGILVAVMGILVLLFALEYMSNLYFVQGDNAVADKKYAEAISLYQRAEALDPLNYGAYINESDVYYVISQGLTGEAQSHYLSLALAKVKKSLTYDSINAEAFEDESFIFQEGNNLPSALSAMKQAVAADPTNNLDRHIRLVSLYVDSHDYADALTLMQGTIAKFPPSLFTSPVYGDPSKGQWETDIINMLGIEIAIYTVDKQPTQAAAAKALLKEYQALPKITDD